MMAPHIAPLRRKVAGRERLGGNRSSSKSYQVLYGDSVALAGCDLHAGETNVHSEQFGTEYEALRRARELLDEDASTIVAVRDPAGDLLSGVRLQLRLGHLCT